MSCTEWRAVIDAEIFSALIEARRHWEGLGGAKDNSQE
jgi:hypothetical protein